MAIMKISNTLVNDDKSQKIAYARQIYDEIQKKFQSNINEDLYKLRIDFDTLVGSDKGDIDDVINTFKEIEAFLIDYNEGDTLTTVIEKFLKPLRTDIQAIGSPLAIEVDDETGELIAYSNTSLNQLSEKSQLNPETGQIEIVYTF